MGDLYYANFGGDSDPELDKKQAAAYRRRSTRWVENQKTAGLPYHRDERGRMMVWKSDLDAWCKESAANG